VQAIEEFIYLAKKISEDNNRGEGLGLNSEEIAFYEVLGDNESAL
jgi:hypothetical protein